MKVIVTGSDGFLGKNLCLRLKESKVCRVFEINRDTSKKNALSFLKQADFVFHFAGVNRPKNIEEFKDGNADFTKFIVNALQSFDRYVPIVLSSSIKVLEDNSYGASKLAAEKIVEEYSENTGAPHYIFRFPNIFGKWSKPNYNSFVATFCYNIMNNIDIEIHDKSSKIKLVYIDDICNDLLELLKGNACSGIQSISNEYDTTVGEIAKIITSFKLSRKNQVVERVGSGLTRALYSTFLSFTPPDKFSHSIESNVDERGIFCEMLKTKDSGQISFFTAHPGVTRGEHYHHSKNEKFLVIKGAARFKFKNIITGEVFHLNVKGKTPKLVYTIPGWAHDITNIGSDELIVMLWANEIFDPQTPDTIAFPLQMD